MQAVCRVCKRQFDYRSKDAKGNVKNATEPTICGELYCVAVDSWDDEMWAGRARMARGREAEGTVLVRERTDDGSITIRRDATDPLNDLDREALRRAGSI